MEEKQNNLTRILDFMKDKEKVHLKEIWESTAINKNSVMGLINKSIKEQKHFERLGKGYYKLKDGIQQDIQ